eukprot:scaffold1344_cov221-Pinguiococcus_pyrenoidosus.AAC.4
MRPTLNALRSGCSLFSLCTTFSAAKAIMSKNGAPAVLAASSANAWAVLHTTQTRVAPAFRSCRKLYAIPLVGSGPSPTAAAREFGSSGLQYMIIGG